MSSTSPLRRDPNPTQHAMKLLLRLTLCSLASATLLAAEQPAPAPANLKGYESQVGQSFTFLVTGNARAGSVWGSDIYTTDSALAAAAVHAGAVANGASAAIKVTMLPGQGSYTGTARNGVTTAAWGAYAVSYRVEPASGEVTAAPANLTAFQGSVGKTMSFRVTGSTSGSVWGTDKYTCDSSLAAAAVHAGLVRPGESAVLRITIVPGEAAYSGTARNGVTSSAWGSFPASFTLAKD